MYKSVLPNTSQQSKQYCWTLLRTLPVSYSVICHALEALLVLRSVERYTLYRWKCYCSTLLMTLQKVFHTTLQQHFKILVMTLLMPRILKLTLLNTVLAPPVTNSVNVYNTERLVMFSGTGCIETESYSPMTVRLYLTFLDCPRLKSTLHL